VSTPIIVNPEWDKDIDYYVKLLKGWRLDVNYAELRVMDERIADMSGVIDVAFPNTDSSEVVPSVLGDWSVAVEDIRLRLFELSLYSDLIVSSTSVTGELAVKVDRIDIRAKDMSIFDMSGGVEVVSKSIGDWSVAVTDVLVSTFGFDLSSDVYVDTGGIIANFVTTDNDWELTGSASEVYLSTFDSDIAWAMSYSSSEFKLQSLNTRSYQSETLVDLSFDADFGFNLGINALDFREIALPIELVIDGFAGMHWGDGSFTGRLALYERLADDEWLHLAYDIMKSSNHDLKSSALDIKHVVLHFHEELIVDVSGKVDATTELGIWTPAVVNLILESLYKFSFKSFTEEYARSAALSLREFSVTVTDFTGTFGGFECYTSLHVDQNVFTGDFATRDKWWSAFGDVEGTYISSSKYDWGISYTKSEIVLYSWKGYGVMPLLRVDMNKRGFGCFFSAMNFRDIDIPFTLNVEGAAVLDMVGAEYLTGLRLGEPRQSPWLEVVSALEVRTSQGKFAMFVNQAHLEIMGTQILDMEGDVDVFYVMAPSFFPFPVSILTASFKDLQLYVLGVKLETDMLVKYAVPGMNADFALDVKYAKLRISNSNILYMSVVMEVATSLHWRVEINDLLVKVFPQTNDERIISSDRVLVDAMGVIARVRAPGWAMVADHGGASIESPGYGAWDIAFSFDEIRVVSAGSEIVRVTMSIGGFDAEFTAVDFREIGLHHSYLTGTASGTWKGGMFSADAYVTDFDEEWLEVTSKLKFVEKKLEKKFVMDVDYSSLRVMGEHILSMSGGVDVSTSPEDWSVTVTDLDMTAYEVTLTSDLIMKEARYDETSISPSSDSIYFKCDYHVTSSNGYLLSSANLEGAVRDVSSWKVKMANVSLSLADSDRFISDDELIYRPDLLLERMFLSSMCGLAVLDGEER
jgi:hypothetical protein